MPTQPFEFTLSGDPITPEEQPNFANDLHRLGLDERCWHAMNGLLTTRSRSDTPMVLRGYRAGRLVGVAHFLECRRTGQCLFPGRVGQLLDLVPTPMYCWTRGDATVDLLSSPGFVASGEDRSGFYRAAVAFLNSRYLCGSVIDPRDEPAVAECYETVFMDWGHYTVERGGVERLVAAHKNLKRKENKFRNKGGIVEVVEGKLTPTDRDAALECIGHSAGMALVRAPFQENYANMVRWAAESDAPGIIHILARLDGRVVGYHTFLRTGVRLQCLSGGFDRSRATTFHAYENILLASMRWAESEGLAAVAFGPTSNPSKAALMPGFERFVIRFYSRYSLVRRLFGALVPRSPLRKENLASCTNLLPKVATCESPIAEPAREYARELARSG